MSKSVTEQFQIKKKRKPNHNAYRNPCGATSRAATFKSRQTTLGDNLRKLPQHHKHPYFVESAITSNGRCLRDKTLVKMPLSQSFYAKDASKRSLKELKVVGEAKRKLRENQEARHKSEVHSNCNNFLKSSTVSATTLYGNQLRQQLANGSSPPQHSNSLQFSYLLGESLASYGRVQEAFDIYALIASEHHDDYIPLDRLNTLAASLISYVRKMNSRQDDTGSTNADPDIGAANKRSGYAVESSLKAKFPSKQQATWNMQHATSATSHVPNRILDMNLDLHAPTRELLSVPPSPVLCDDYDPLLCPLCRDILRCPVTTNCGHTFCRQCCETITMCNICHIKFPKFTLEELVSEPRHAKNTAYSSLQATTSLVTTSSPSPSSSMSTSVSTTNSTGAYNSSPGLATNASLLMRRLNNNSFFAAGSNMTDTTPRLHLIAAAVASPTTVTTTTVASTTATATTTMASTSAASSTAIGASDNMKFMPDVLVRRLVEKWWGPDLQANKINETAASYMHLNLLDDALKFCNASLEKSPTNFKSLLLRAEVLRKLNQYQSSLADVENALKCRYASAKAHYLRALALSELGRFEEALYGNCLAISLDRSTNLTTSELFQHDLAKILQKLFAQAPKIKFGAPHQTFASSAPYRVLAQHRLRRKQIALLSNANGDHFSSFDEDFMACGGQQCGIIVDDEEEDVALGGSGYVDGKRSTYAKDYELAALRRHTSRKHFRRKWMTKETELLPSVALDDAHCSAVFRNILERTQQEVQRLKKLDLAGESPHQQLVQLPAGLIDVSDFDCVLCCRTFWKPVVTPCGHTYCWVCLDRCMDYTSSCPLCMSPLVEPNVNMYQGSSSPVPFILAKRPVTKFLEAAMKRFIPDSYAKRFRQEMDMEPSVPVFICTTAFPYVPCPLFVYEPRYRLMVRRAVESGEKQFGIVQPHSGKSRYFDVGTILDIRDCVLLGDGCSILSTVGCKRFKILARNEKDGYETAKVEYIYDESISDENAKFVSSMHATVLSKAIEWFESLSTELKQEILQSFGEMPSVEDNWESIADGPAWAWWIIALLPLSQQLKVDILATTSLEKRLRAIEKTLDYMSGTYRRSQQHCNVVVVQQQQQQQHECDNNELTPTCQNADECWQRTSTALASTGEPHTPTGEHEAQLML